MSLLTRSGPPRSSDLAYRRAIPRGVEEFAGQFRIPFAQSLRRAPACAAKTKREAVMVITRAGVYQSLLVFFGGVAVFLGGAADFGGGASNALSMPSNWARRSSLIWLGGSSTASPRR